MLTEQGGTATASSRGPLARIRVRVQNLKAHQPTSAAHWPVTRPRWVRCPAAYELFFSWSPGICHGVRRRGLATSMRFVIFSSLCICMVGASSKPEQIVRLQSIQPTEVPPNRCVPFQCAAPCDRPRQYRNGRVVAHPDAVCLHGKVRGRRRGRASRRWRDVALHNSIDRSQHDAVRELHVWGGPPRSSDKSSARYSVLLSGRLGIKAFGPSLRPGTRPQQRPHQ